MMMNFPAGMITWISRCQNDKLSTWAASSSAFGTDPRAASVIKAMNGIHIQLSTTSTAGNASVASVVKSIFSKPMSSPK